MKRARKGRDLARALSISQSIEWASQVSYLRRIGGIGAKLVAGHKAKAARSK